jgi:hypothetical protein
MANNRAYVKLTILENGRLFLAQAAANMPSLTLPQPYSI